MPVPSSYPSEPHASSCGASWRQGVFIDGELPDTNRFGRQFKHSLSPVVFSDGNVNPPLFTSRKNLDAELNVHDGFNDHLEALKRARREHYKYFSKADSESLRWLVLQVEDLRRRAQAHADQISPFTASAATRNAAAQAVALISEALPFLRCAGYWTWRVILYGQARDAYHRPPTLGLTSAPVPMPPRAAPEATLPPPPPPPPLPPPPDVPWYRTTAGKVGIAIGVAAILGGTTYGVVRYTRRAA